MTTALRFDAVRPLVRYVDEDQAVIDTHFSTLPALPGDPDWRDGVIDVLLHLAGGDGFEDEGRTRLTLSEGEGSFRFEIVHPQRWWPATLGEQPLYDLTVTLAQDDELSDERKMTLGLTSVRRDSDGASLLVNGRNFTIESVVFVDAINERQLLPATGGSLLLVRDHYGDKLLYDAADRAGILLIQCVPIGPDGTPDVEVQAQVERLSPHPSLAGWFVGNLGELSDRVAELIRELDPTRTVYREYGELPAVPAA